MRGRIQVQGQQKSVRAQKSRFSLNPAFKLGIYLTKKRIKTKQIGREPVQWVVFETGFV